MTTTATATIGRRNWTKTLARDIRPNDELRDGRVLSVSHTAKLVSVKVEAITGNQTQLLRADARESVAKPLDAWVPAAGGTEEPFRTRTGRILLYVWNAATQQHAYLDCQTDIILTDADAFFHLTPPTDTADLY